MVTNHDVWDAVAQTDGTPGNSFEFLLGIQPAAGGAHVRTADITNVNPAFTAKNRNRQTYAAKGVDSMLKYGETLVLTWDHEVVRDANGQYDAILQDLVDASKSKGQANLRSIQAYDALGADYAFQSKFAISISRSGTDWDSAAFFTITATQYGATTWIDNPVLVGNVPVIEAVSPDTPVAAAAHLFIQGRGFEGVTGAASVKIGTTNATSYSVVSDTLIDAVMPAGSAGATYVRVTNPDGVGEDFPIVRGA